MSVHNRADTDLQVTALHSLSHKDSFGRDKACGYAFCNDREEPRIIRGSVIAFLTAILCPPFNVPTA